MGPVGGARLGLACASGDAQLELDQLKAALANALDCSICLNRLEAPVTLACGHSFCERCAMQCLSSVGKCPSCRATIHRTELPAPSITLRHLLELLPQSAAESSQDEEQTMHGHVFSGAESNSITIQSKNYTELPLFLVELPIFPGQPLQLFLWEPRYLLLVERILRGRRRFGIQRSIGAFDAPEVGAVGTVVQVTRADKDQHGRWIVEGRGLHRYNAATPISEESDSGGLFYCKADVFNDHVSSTADDVETLRKHCAARVTCLLDALGPLDRREVREKYGEPPNGTGLAAAEALSLWLASALRFPPSVKLAMLESRDTARRLEAAEALLVDTEGVLNSIESPSDITDTSAGNGNEDGRDRRCGFCRDRIRQIWARQPHDGSNNRWWLVGVARICSDAFVGRTRGNAAAAAFGVGGRSRARAAGGPAAGWLLLILLLLLAVQNLHTSLFPEIADFNENNAASELAATAGLPAVRSSHGVHREL
eukprot:SAG31_NODE_4308_length_3369_cov_2.531804_4_plen_483_part_00